LSHAYPIFISIIPFINFWLNTKTDFFSQRHRIRNNRNEIYRILKSESVSWKKVPRKCLWDERVEKRLFLQNALHFRDGKLHCWNFRASERIAVRIGAHLTLLLEFFSKFLTIWLQSGRSFRIDVIVFKMAQNYRFFLNFWPFIYDIQPKMGFLDR